MIEANKIVPATGDLDPAARALVVAVSRAADSHRDEIVQLMVDRISAEIDGLTEEPRLVELLALSADTSVSANLEMLEHDIDVKWVAVPGAAAEYARVAAQRGYPVTILETGTRLTRNVILRWCLNELGVLGDDPAVVARAAVDLMTRLTAWTDHHYSQLTEIFEASYEAWLRHRTTRSALIEDIVQERPVDKSSLDIALGYRLAQSHLGLVAWCGSASDRGDELTRLQDVVGALARHLGCTARPLIEPRDERTVWAWLPLGTNRRIDYSALNPVVDSVDTSVLVALGTPKQDLEGFRRTHEQAAQAAVVGRSSQVADLHIIPICDVGAVALMCSDIQLTRRWVRDVLGPLADDDDAMVPYRETLRTFLATGSSFTTTATSLTMHKNSIIYRLRKIEKLLDESVRNRRLELEIALTLTHWLGPAVLQPTPPNS